jgi:hypothetical protein
MLYISVPTTQPILIPSLMGNDIIVSTDDIVAPLDVLAIDAIALSCLTVSVIV